MHVESSTTATLEPAKHGPWSAQPSGDGRTGVQGNPRAPCLLPGLHCCDSRLQQCRRIEVPGRSLFRHCNRRGSGVPPPIPEWKLNPGKHSPPPSPAWHTHYLHSTTAVRCGSAHLQRWEWCERVGATPTFSDWPAKRGEGQDTNAALDTSCCVERPRWLHLCAVSCELRAAAGLTLHKCSLQNLSSPPRRIRVPAYRPTSLAWVPTQK